MSRSAQLGELARRVGVKLLVGVMVALAIVYLPMAAAVKKAELARAMAGVGFGPTVFSGGPEDLAPGTWRVLSAVVGLVIVAAVYWSFEAPRRASIMVGAFSLIAVALALELDNALGFPFLVVFTAVGGSMALTIWHDRWLGDYVEDEPA